MVQRAWRNVLGSARLVAELLVIVAVCEVVVMLLLPSLAPGLSAWQDAFLDALVLSVMAAPLVTWRAHRMARRVSGPSVAADASSAAYVRHLPLLVFVLGTGLSVWLAWGLYGQAQHAARARFEQVADSLRDTVQARFDRAADGLHDIRSASVLAGHVLSHQELRTWVATRNLRREFPGLVALSLVRPVPRSEQPAYEARMRAQGVPAFEVRTSGQSPMLYVVDAIEPLAPNHLAMGFDVGSEPARKEALQRAIDTGEAALSAQVHLVQLGRPQAAFLYVLPLYKPGLPLETVAQRRAALDALVSAPILADDLLDGLDLSLTTQAQYALYDVSGGQTPVLLAQSDASNPGEQASAQPQFASNHAITVGGRTLALRIRSTPAFDVDNGYVMAVWLVLLGVLLSAMAAVSVWLMNTGRARARQMAQAMTADLQAAQAQLRAHSQQMSAIFSLSPDAFVSFDMAGRVSYISPAWTRLTGLSSQALLGLSEDSFSTRLFECAARGQAIQGLDALKQATPAEGVAGDVAEATRVVVEMKPPARRMLEMRLILSEGGAVSQVLHVRDVTIETEVDQMKSAFLSVAAHELRTPMASIYGFTELLLTRDLAPDKQKDLLGRIYRQSEAMKAIIDELLDLARIEARQGKDFSFNACNLTALLDEVIRDFKLPPDRTAPLIAWPDQAILVWVDRQKMQRAALNVLSNAYKYSPQGGDVRVRILTQDRQGRPHVGIEIQDQGIGLAPDQLARVGERFYRADKSGSIPGTGLGVAIVKEIMELMGGHVALHSEQGLGSTFTLWLPRMDEQVVLDDRR